MKYITHGIAGVFLAGSLSWAAHAADVSPPWSIITYPAPQGAAMNDDFSVKVRTPGGEWREAATYLVKVAAMTETGNETKNSSLAIFDFSGAVDVSITYNRGDIRSARVRPLAAGIVPEVSGKTIAFSLAGPRNLSVEVNGDIFGNLQLFANPVETSRPDPGDPDVIYYGPGIHRVAGDVLHVPSGKTVYIAGGAVVVGAIACDRVKNVRVLGRGMLDQAAGGIRISNSKNVGVSGIFTRQIYVGGSRGVTITNVKCMSFGRWGDGIDVIASREVVIDGVFNRNSDDCIAVYATRGESVGGSARITVRNSTLWADVAHPILVGTHGSTRHPDTIEDLRFSNIDILDHNEAQIDYQGCMSLDAGDDNLIRNVRFEDIRVEDFRQGQLFNLRVFYNRKYNTSPGRGIENVVFKNITYSGTHAEQSVIAGYNESRAIRNVVFENLIINGKLITDRMSKPGWHKPSDLARIFVGDHVTGLEFRAPAEIQEPPSADTPPSRRR